jgi:hypothetical protein
MNKRGRTLYRAMSLPSWVRIGLGDLSAFGYPSLGSLKKSRPECYRKVSNFITRTKTGKQKRHTGYASRDETRGEAVLFSAMLCEAQST